MTQRSTSADFVTAFATGWPENQPEIMVLSLTTAKGIQDFALNKEQALLIAKTMKDTAAQLKKAETSELKIGDASRAYERDSEMDAPRNWLSALITTDCRLPRVVNEIFAVNPGALATTWKLPLAPRPSRLPVTPRLDSLHVPESDPPLATTLLARLNL